MRIWLHVNPADYINPLLLNFVVCWDNFASEYGACGEHSNFIPQGKSKLCLVLKNIWKDTVKLNCQLMTVVFKLSVITCRHLKLEVPWQAANIFLKTLKDFKGQAEFLTFIFKKPYFPITFELF